jgi:hypothetical protein
MRDCDRKLLWRLAYDKVNSMMEEQYGDGPFHLAMASNHMKTSRPYVEVCTVQVTTGYIQGFCFTTVPIPPSSAEQRA